jgi:hypothetical protein
MMPPTRAFLYGLALISAIATAHGQRTAPVPQPETVGTAKAAGQTKTGAPEMKHRSVDFAKDPRLVAAAKVRPVAPEALARKIPAEFGAFERGTVETKVHELGPAMYSEARTPLTAKGGKRALLSLTDCAGIPPEMLGRTPLPAPGDTKDGRRGLEVAGFRAATESAPATAKVEVQLSPRLYLTIEGDKVKPDELLAVARSLDLAGIANLAP